MLPPGRLVLPIPGAPPVTMPTSAWRALVPSADGDLALEAVLATLRPTARASMAERQLVHALRTDDTDALTERITGGNRVASTARLLVGLRLLEDDPERAAEALAALLESDADPDQDVFVHRYVPDLHVWCRLVPSVRAVLPVSREAVVLVLVDAYTRLGRPAEAVHLLEVGPETPLTALALGAGYLARGRFEAVVELTDRTRNTDERTALSLVTRAVALRALDRLDQALATVNGALADEGGSPGVIAIALEERAQIYMLQGDEAAAEADAERLMTLEGFDFEAGAGRPMSEADTKVRLDVARARVRPQLRGTGATGAFGGRHHHAYRDEVRSMLEAGLVESAEHLLLGLLDAVEYETTETGLPADRTYYETLADLYALQDRRFEEYAVLERHARRVGGGHGDAAMDQRRAAVAEALGIAEEIASGGLQV